MRELIYDLYHETSNRMADALGINNKTCVFELFIRNEDLFFTPPDFPSRILSIAEEYDEYFDRINILGLRFNKGLLPVTAHMPIVQVQSTGLRALYLESVLINVVQLDLIYTKRLLEIKQATNKPVLDFALRRAPGLSAAKRFSEIATQLGMKTSNTLVAHKRPEMLVGTLPHAFVQYNIFDDIWQKDVLVKKEARLWIELYKKFGWNVLLADTLDSIELAKSIKEAGYGNVNWIIRLDSGDITSQIKAISEILPNAKFVISGDLTASKIRKYEKSRVSNLIIGYAIGTQVANNIKPLSIVFKLVEVNGWPVYKFAPGKKQYPYAKHSVYEGDTVILEKGLLKDGDTAVYDPYSSFDTINHFVIHESLKYE